VYSCNFNVFVVEWTTRKTWYVGPGRCLDVWKDPETGHVPILVGSAGQYRGVRLVTLRISDFQ
ncbi:MAG: hypothetical protein ACOC41_08600, partial [Chitinivibrionales bacterium]